MSDETKPCKDIHTAEEMAERIHDVMTANDISLPNEGDLEPAEPVQPAARCPSCRATDNNPYMDAFGQNMRACGRCNIQWVDESAHAPSPSAQPAAIKRYRLVVFDKGATELQAYGHPDGAFVLYSDHLAAHAPTPSAPSEKRCSVCGFDMADTQVRCIKCDSYIPAPPAVERILTYADHLPSCTSRKNSTSGCNCGFCSALDEVKKEKK